MKSKIRSLDSSSKTKMSLDLSKRLIQFLSESFHDLDRKIVGVFAPLKDEVNWDEADITGMIKTAYPTNGSSGMSFLKCSADELVETEVFGVKILAPDEGEVCTPDILIIPGLSFSEKGERLGRGKAFYDHYLENFSGPKVGVCFDLQVLEELPTEEHDRLMDFVVTEARVINASVD